MKKLLILPFVLISFFVVAQGPPTPNGHTKINMRYDWLSGSFQSLRFPIGPATPTTYGGALNKGNVFWDSVGKKLRIFDGAYWRNYPDSVYVPVGDSLLHVRYGVTDVVVGTFHSGGGGGGGGGAPNTNAGSGFRWAIIGGNQIKTFFGANGILLDSSSNANALTAKADTSFLQKKVKLSKDFGFRGDSLFNAIPINVQDYGVVADGVTNNYTALSIIQTWAGSRPLYFPKASNFYLVNPPGTNGLALNPKQVVYGDGDSSRIKTTGNTVLFFLNDYVEIHHLHLIGSGQNAAGVPLQSLLLGFEIHSPSIHDNYLEGCAGDASNIRYGGAISICDVNDIAPNYHGGKIYANTIVDNTVGIYLSHNGEYVAATGNTVNSNTTGIWLTGGNYTITGNHCDENDTNIKITNDNNSGHGVIDGNTFNHGQTYAIYIDGISQGQIFTNCKFYYGGGVISNSNGIVFVGCDIIDPGHTVTWTLTNNTNIQVANSRFPKVTNNVAISLVSGENFSEIGNLEY